MLGYRFLRMEPQMLSERRRGQGRTLSGHEEGGLHEHPCGKVHQCVAVAASRVGRPGSEYLSMLTKRDIGGTLCSSGYQEKPKLQVGLVPAYCLHTTADRSSDGTVILLHAPGQPVLSLAV